MIVSSSRVKVVPMVPDEQKELEHISLGVTISANGDLLPTQVIMPIKTIFDEWLDPEITRWQYKFRHGASGWADKVGLSHISYYKHFS